MPAGTSPEIALMQRVRAGDAQALEALMEAFTPRVYRLAYGITRCAGDAEEVVQDVFLSLFKKADTFEARSAIWTWIYRITTNAALNKRRSKRTYAELPIDDHLPAYLEDGHRAGDRAYVLSDWSAAPEEQVLAAERRATIAAALDALPDHYRAVLVLRDVEGLSHEDIAAVVGGSVASVKSRVHRARMALREDLTLAAYHSSATTARQR
jgi:RNA polymerase sigma-70 factor, ECF subfamily